MSRKEKRGALVMASTHIGNIRDTPQRTLEELKIADFLIFEEDRPARQLLKEAGIHRSYMKFNEHKAEYVLEELKQVLKEGKKAVFVSDQGAPVLADPGKELLELAYSLDAKIEVIPGPSSITAAISACPFDMRRFLFYGFLASERVKRERELRSLLNSKETLVFLEAPYRLEPLLKSCWNVFGKSKRAFLALDISGQEEEFIVGDFEKMLKETKGKKLNFVLILES